jgi:hypothetical protein
VSANLITGAYRVVASVDTPFFGLHVAQCRQRHIVKYPVTGGEDERREVVYEPMRASYNYLRIILRF